MSENIILDIDLKSKKKKERNHQYYLNNKEEILQKAQLYRDTHKAESKIYQDQYRIDNKEQIKERKKKRYERDKPKIKLQLKASAIRRKDKIKVYKKEYYQENKEWILEDMRNKYDEDHKKRMQKRVDLFKLFGGKCVLCGKDNIDFLVFDHINNDGTADREENKTRSSIEIVRRLVRNNVPIEQIKEKFQVLCANCNSIKQSRKYFDLPNNEITNAQRYKIKLWKEAYNFFGPCKMCGETNIKTLSIDHINGDGSEKRKNGEGIGTSLLSTFRKNNWPESIKEEYQLLCFNCHYGIKPRIENPKISVKCLQED